MKFNSLAVFFVVATFFCGAVIAHPSDNEESLRSLLAMEIDKTTLDEAQLPLANLRVSSTENQSVLSWRVKDNIYTYTLMGSRHVERTLSLLQLFNQGRLTTVVVEKVSYRTEKFASFYRIKAFQWAVNSE